MEASTPLTAETLVYAYASGMFPMAEETGEIFWYSPDPRAIIPIQSYKPAKSLRPIINQNRFEIRVNTSFEQVMRNCALPRATEDETWISEEIVQDVFLKIWLKREVFSGVHDFEAYLFITARNHILNCLRSRMKEVVFLDYLHSYFVVSEDVTSILHTKEIHKFIAEARELLPPQQRRVFELSRYEGLNYQAIAEKLDISTLTVKSHMTKALNFIRLRLELLDMFYFLLIHVGFMYN